MHAKNRRLAVAGFAALALGGAAAPAAHATTADVRATAPAVSLGLSLNTQAIVSPLLEDVLALTHQTVTNVTETAQGAVNATSALVNATISTSSQSNDPALINVQVGQTVSASAQSALISALQARAEAQAAGDSVAISAANQRVTAAIQSRALGIATLRVRRIVSGAVRRVRATGDFSLRTVRGLRVDPISVNVASSLRRLGITSFAVIDGNGRVLQGPGVAGVHTLIGAADIQWRASVQRCAQVAMTNGLVPRSLHVGTGRGLHTGVADVSVGATARLPLRNVTVAVLC